MLAHLWPPGQVYTASGLLASSGRATRIVHLIEQMHQELCGMRTTTHPKLAATEKPTDFRYGMFQHQLLL